MLKSRSTSSVSLALTIAACLLCALGCKNGEQVATPTEARVYERHPATVAIDSFDQQLAALPQDDDVARLELYTQRWLLVQQAVAYHGTTHRDAFYGSRAYWHTGSTRGIGWTQDQQGDLDVFFTVPGKGNVRVLGDVNADIEIAGNSIVHILGDLNATLDLKGVCEVIIAGNLTKYATIICDGQLELFVAGNAEGILGSTASSTIIIDGHVAGTIQAGAPATTLTITGDLLGEIPPPQNKNAVLTLRVDGNTPTAKMLDLAAAGFTRVNAVLGTSDAPPGLYPQDQNATRPTARWVVLKQFKPDLPTAE